MSISSESTILATGGLGSLYPVSDNPPSIFGSGYSMAYNVGARLVDMEFIQFLPVIDEPGLQSITVPDWLFELLKSEDERILRSPSGKPILAGHGLLERRILRDALSIAIGLETQSDGVASGKALLDLTRIPTQAWTSLGRLQFFRRLLSRHGIDPGDKPLPLGLSAHHSMGGVKIDENGWTGVPGLYAAGEVCGGVHGANRLGGYGLTEAIVFGVRAGKSAAEHSTTGAAEPPDLSEAQGLLNFLDKPPNPHGDPGKVMETVRILIDAAAGQIRNGEALSEALERILSLNEASVPKLYAKGVKQLVEALKCLSALTLAEIVLRSALTRTESRGVHYRVDCPRRNDSEWLRNILIRQEDGRIKVETKRVT